jgi:hypothetical protein
MLPPEAPEPPLPSTLGTVPDPLAEQPARPSTSNELAIKELRRIALRLAQARSTTQCGAPEEPFNETEIAVMSAITGA